MVYAVSVTSYYRTEETVSLLECLQIAVTYNHVINDTIAVRHADFNYAAPKVSYIH